MRSSTLSDPLRKRSTPWLDTFGSCHGAVRRWILLLSVAGLVSSGLPSVRADDATGKDFFERRIRPVLVRYCYECHSSAVSEPKGGLRLDSREAARKGGESGAAVVPGRPEESLLISAVKHESLEMPPGERLPEKVVDDLVQWIRRGAADPRDHPVDSATAANQAWEAQYAERRQWWSLQSVRNPDVPDVQDREWPAGSIDRFVLASLEERGLQPAPRTDRRTLARRLSFALTGLPPTNTDVEAFVNDSSADAWQKQVDRLLASPRFGERWARHWMDVVRYTDTYGYEWDIPAKGAWRYRDYLIRAFNDDVPFDRLVREHIAGDLLARPRINETEKINESLLGLMFLQMGEKRHGDSAEFDGIHQEMLDNKIDAFGKAFQAMTLSCARCHDHKLDAVAQTEYYALAGVFMSSRWITNTVDLPSRDAAAKNELKTIKARLRPLLASVWLQDLRNQDLEPLLRQLVRDGKSEETDRSVEDPLHCWQRLQQVADDGLGTSDAWISLAEQYRKEQEERAAKNAAHSDVIADFRQCIPEGWSTDGMGLEDIARCGDLAVSLEEDAFVGRVLHGGLCTDSLSPRMNGAVRTPWLSTLGPGPFSIELSGGDFAATRIIVDNAFLTERQQYIDQKHPTWREIVVPSDLRNRHVYLEVATKTSNPNFPPRVGLGGPCSEEQAADPRSWFAIARVIRHDAGFAPLDELDRFVRLLDSEPPTTLGAAAQRFSAWFCSSVIAWAEDRSTDDDVRLINWLLDRGLLTNRAGNAGHPEIAALVDRYREVEATLSVPWTVNGVADLDAGFDYPLNIRGDYDQLGNPVPRGYLRVIAGPCEMRPSFTTRTADSDASSADSGSAALSTRGSGRRQLANLIADPRNPLTARVFVNRVWHWLFGAGIVRTPDDFGHAGDFPSHPDLLDHLSRRFMDEGWSLKRLVREIVLSETWRQSQHADARAPAMDPANRLLHHYPVRRLEAEAIRDAMLYVSGRLDDALFGAPLDPPRQSEDPQKRLFSGPLDGEGRRSIYTKVTVMEPPRFLAVFNQPKPKIPIGKRDVTTTPAQALTLLNDPFVMDQAEHWAARLVIRQPETAFARVTYMFRRALGRPPTAEESARWVAAVQEMAEFHQVADKGLAHSRATWKDVAHALFNSQEFIYLR